MKTTAAFQMLKKRGTFIGISPLIQQHESRRLTRDVENPESYQYRPNSYKHNINIYKVDHTTA